MNIKKNLIRGVISGLAAIGTLGAGLAAADAAGLVELRPELTAEDSTNPIAAKGCVIRFDTLNAGGTAVVPRILEDSSHRCVGVTAVSLEANGDLRLTNTGGQVQVVTTWVVPDETLAATFRSCGISGGGTVSIVRCYKADGVRVNFGSIADVYSAGSNVWYGGLVWDATP